MLKLKRNIRWIIPLLIMVLVAAYFIVGPMVGAHAASAGPLYWSGK